MASPSVRASISDLLCSIDDVAERRFVKQLYLVISRLERYRRLRVMVATSSLGIIVLASIFGVLVLSMPFGLVVTSSGSSWALSAVKLSLIGAMFGILLVPSCERFLSKVCTAMILAAGTDFIVLISDFEIGRSWQMPLGGTELHAVFRTRPETKAWKWWTAKLRTIDPDISHPEDLERLMYLVGRAEEIRMLGE